MRETVGRGSWLGVHRGETEAGREESGAGLASV